VPVVAVLAGVRNAGDERGKATDMDMLQQILGGQSRDQMDDFVRRYDQGAPWDGIDDREALDQYRRVAPALSDDDYVAAAQASFSRLSPDQRAEYGAWLQQEAARRGTQVTDLDGDGMQDAARLANATNHIRRQQPGLLEGLLGGSQGGGGLTNSPVAKGALAGIAATAASKFLSR
jgi:hypothetical protein